jgi:hypothetical protein
MSLQEAVVVADALGLQGQLDLEPRPRLQDIDQAQRTAANAVEPGFRWLALAAV